MRITEIAITPSTDDRRRALDLVERVEAHTGTPQLSDHLRLDLGREPDDGTAPIVVTVLDDAEPIAIAQLSAANEAWLLEVVVDPRIHDAVAVRDDLADTAVDAHRRHRDDAVVWWMDDPSEHDESVAGRLGLVTWRALYEMRRTLPHPQTSDVATRSFRPGIDDEAWLGVNNRAFADHGEQGGWTIETLRLRQAEPWFDPDGFRLLDDEDGNLIAFCWTKLHTDQRPVVGEIYVIAVDPSAHGRGLGRQLTLAGLDSISDRGVTIANLYVDAGNTAAVSLYERLGFGIHRRRVAFAPPEHATP
ncbi:MAG: mycothiol synthase [Ilumatobacter sp.]|nr:mycothiol synthase [Ilumatobacter sp.]